MAAGLGFKTFVSGEVLTAADTNGYLMQGVLVFANASARTAAVTSPEEGQYSYLKDTNALEYYDGAAWVGQPIGDITAITAGSGISVTSGTGPIPTVALDLASANTFTAAQTATRFIVTGSTIATNGMYLTAANTLAFSTNSALRMTIFPTGEVGIGYTPTLGRTLQLGKDMTGAAGTYGINNGGSVRSDSTSFARMYASQPDTQATAFTVSELSHYYAATVTVGAGSTVTNQYGFIVPSGFTTATNNYAFFSAIASGTNRWNAYMSGTAGNYFAGRTGVGVLLTTSAQFGVTNTQGTAEITILSRNFAAQTSESLNIQDSASSLIFGVTAAGLMKYISGNTATTVGAAGVASALPANPTGYLKIDIGGTNFKVPYYAN